MFYKFFGVIFIGWLIIIGNWRIAAGAEFTDFGPYRGKVGGCRDERAYRRGSNLH